MKPLLPVTVIGGYLGCGKTTLVNHLLRHANGVRLAVLVNDFGELPIDADLIEAEAGANSSDVISLTGGCVCCSYGDDLSLSLQKLLTRESLPDHVFIEASGVALPGAIGRSLSLQRAYQLEGIVVLADAASVQNTASEKYIGDTIQRQLNDADLIVLNKQDLLSDSLAATVRQWVNEHYAHAPRVDTVHSAIAPGVLFDMKRSVASQEVSSSDSTGNADQGRIHHNKPHDNHNVSSVFSTISLTISQQVDAHELAATLADKRCGLVRAKGFVMHVDNTLKTIQVVGRRWSVTDAPVGVSTGVVCIACMDQLSEERIRSLCGLNASAAI
ncbi:MAG: GTP-binding protein [Granulosicoccus sp.]